MPSDAEERAIEVMARAIAYDVRPPKLDHLDIFDYWHTLAVDDMATFRGQAQAAYAALRAHDAETLNRVVMDSAGRTENDIIALAQAHQMEVRVLYEALERALSHFVIIGGDQAVRAAEEIEELLNGVMDSEGNVVRDEH